jgi:SAM-dependent methyltransferase
VFTRKAEQHQNEAFVGLETAQSYADKNEKSGLKYRAFMKVINALRIQGRYLDVGAGTGNIAAAIVQNNPEVKITALEISGDMVTVGEAYINGKRLEDKIKFIQGDAVDEETINTIGVYDLIYSTYSLHHWENPRKVIDNLMSALSENGVLYLYDLRRVWWLYWIPNNNGFFNSIRAAYVRREIKEILRRYPSDTYEVKNEFPFMQSIIIRNSIAA